MRENKLSIILTVFLLIMIGLNISLFIINNSEKEFVAPSFDESVKIGLPNVQNITDNLIDAYSRYKFYVNPEPIFQNNKLLVNFTSFDDNKVWLKLRVYCNEKIVGETDLIKPNEYIDYLEIENCSNEKISYEIMSYQYDTYYSEGVVKLNTSIKK